MHFESSLDENFGINLEGSYSVASGPDWGWRITLQLDEKGYLQSMTTPKGGGLD